MLPSLAVCSAALGRFTKKARRTLRDELQDRATSAKLGTFSSHSIILSFASFLEVVCSHQELLGTNDAAQQRLRREVAKLKVGAGSLPSSDTALLWLAIGHYAQQSRAPGQRPQLVFSGLRFRGVLTGGVLAKKIVEYVLQQIRGTMTGPAFKELIDYCIVHDVVFGMAVEASSRLSTSAQQHQLLCSDATTISARTPGAALSTSLNTAEEQYEA